MTKQTRTVAMIDHEIATLEDQIRELKAERAAIIKENQRWSFDDDMVNLITIVMQHPGIDKEGIHELMTVAKEDYGKKMTALVRRKCIVNEGTRQAPLWYIAIGEPKKR